MDSGGAGGHSRSRSPRTEREVTPRCDTRALFLLVALLALAGCTSAPTPPRPTPTAARAAPRLDASVAQFRFDEGTRRLKAGVTNQGDTGIRVSRATIDWGALAFPTVRVPDPVALPGQTAAFTISYGAPRCPLPAGPRPTRGRGRATSPAAAPGRGPRPAARLHAKACAQRRLDAAVSVRLRLARPRCGSAVRSTSRARSSYGARAGSTAPLRVDDLGGSVLLDFRPRDRAHALPALLRPGRPVLVLPVLLGSTHRCDAHARGQSSQTFLISTYVRLGQHPQQRVVLPLSTAERVRVSAVVDRECG